MDLDFTRGQYRRIYSGAVFGRRINSVGDFAARIFWHLVAAADDYGNHNWVPVLVRHQLVPLLQRTDEEIAAAMAELEQAGLVARYERRGEVFCHVVGHLELQPAANNGKRVRRFPACPAEPNDYADPDGDSPEPTPTPEPSDPADVDDTPGPGESGGIQKILGNPKNPGESKKSQPYNNNNNNNYNTQQQPRAPALGTETQPVPVPSPAAAAAALKKENPSEPPETDIRSRERPLDVKISGIVRDHSIAAANIGVPPEEFARAVREFPDADWPAIICRADSARADRGLSNPAGYLRRLAQTGVTAPQPSEKMQEKERLQRLRSISQQTRALACVQHGVPPDFDPFSEAWRCRWPGVDLQIRDKIAQCVLDATAMFKRNHPPPGHRPR